MAPSAYFLGALIGRGCFGQVFMAQRKADGAPCVIKQIPLPSMKTEQVDIALNEVSLLQSTWSFSSLSAISYATQKREAHLGPSHPGIIRYLDSFHDAHALHIVMEYADGGDLAQAIQQASAYVFSLFVFLFS